ncbi:hypothetical protein [Flaviaesturariibacter aridisoli]|uniref:Uncharacterized protein n=1 Tax=Flaviaesturariibacter aridisoli TaxID=2545761 RepID=A0A4V2WM97_9BACT|nr:hypothetical protein [Flaviaesturariibacter aridisoli]TCZ67199.1 hypothetical protein E0486_16105 [Flaviaesturariibacter aridisoli]
MLYVAIGLLALALDFGLHIRTASSHFRCAAVAGGAAALLTELIGSVGVFRRQKEALPALLYHAARAFVLLSYGLLAAKGARHFPEPFRAAKTGVMMRVILPAALIFGNYIGGPLVYTYRVGIQKKVP